MDIVYLPPIAFGIVLSITIFISLLYYYKNLKNNDEPFISFVMSVYNGEETVEKSIRKLYKSYDNFELIVVNDCSNDKTLDILKRLKDKYDFKIIDNKENLGKTKSINKGYEYCKGDIIFVLDSDIFLNRKAINNMLERFSEEGVGGVSCRYKIVNKGIIPSMVLYEFGMLAISHSSYNLSSVISLWGGCMAFKREAFEDIGKLKPHMFTEDMDASLSLREQGWKSRQANGYIETYSPSKLKKWFSQKIRWATGGMQCFLEHPKAFLKNPLVILYMGLYLCLAFFSIYCFTAANSIGYEKTLTVIFLYSFMSLPYSLINLNLKKEAHKLLYVVPYSVIYNPIFFFVSILGFIKGVYEYIDKEEGDRAW